jgi:hypothetical protein
MVLPGTPNTTQVRTSDFCDRGGRKASPIRAAAKFAAVERPGRFEEHRWLGDKRNQAVHDLDRCTDPAAIEGILAAETFTCFAPDTLPEARNRGYHLARCCRSTTDLDT